MSHSFLLFHKRSVNRITISWPGIRQFEEESGVGAQQQLAALKRDYLSCLQTQLNTNVLRKPFHKGIFSSNVDFSSNYANKYFVIKERNICINAIYY